jgi:hypothetical protein
MVNQESVVTLIDQLIAIYHNFERSGYKTSEDHSKFVLTGHEIFQSTINLMVSIYGPNSTQVDTLQKQASSFNTKYPVATVAKWAMDSAVGALHSLKREIQAGLIGSLQRQISGEVLTDFLQLSKQAFDHPGDDAKNVAAVLTAALFEDTIRRLAQANGIPHIEKLQDVLTELKNKTVLQGTEVGIAQSYLNFRNSALHAQWGKIDRPSVAGVQGFVEGLLMKHFA